MEPLRTVALFIYILRLLNTDVMAALDVKRMYLLFVILYYFLVSLFIYIDVDVLSTFHMISTKWMIVYIKDNKMNVCECPVSLQDKMAIVNIEWILNNNSINGFGSDGIEFIDEFSDSSHIEHSNFIFRTPNLLCFIDMTNLLNVNDDHILYIGEDFTMPTIDEIVEVNRNQYIAEITRTIESHDATWHPYHSTRIQHSNALDIDDHTISSIERI